MYTIMYIEYYAWCTVYGFKTAEKYIFFFFCHFFHFFFGSLLPVHRHHIANYDLCLMLNRNFQLKNMLYGTQLRSPLTHSSVD